MAHDLLKAFFIVKQEINTAFFCCTDRYHRNATVKRVSGNFIYNRLVLKRFVKYNKRVSNGVIYQSEHSLVAFLHLVFQ